ncbi:MAG: site-specific DNA-methyltransferase [Candidatus Lokiarchaeota archaeon]|nr:site-specific DNA-methyltransferase [Candidatus Lokiarchaeota archaeon]
MTDLVLLLPGQRGRFPDARGVRSIVKERHATVASVCLPAVNAEGSLDKREFSAFHHQHGVDLSAVDPFFRLREIILLKAANMGPDRPVNFCLVYLWNWPDSTYDIDAVRIAHAKKTDPRNNPLGKNPGNVWSFSEPLHDGKDGIQRPLVAPRPAPCVATHVEVEAVRRLIRCHTAPGDVVHGWSAREDARAIEAAARGLGRRAREIAPGSPDPLVEEPIAVSDVEAGAGGGNGGGPASRGVKGGSKENPIARYFIQDAVSGITAHVDQLVDDLVTSPPYNIGYDPFNVPRPDPRSGELVAPRKEGYRDDLPRASYHGMIRNTLAAIDARMNPASADAFINVKNSYAGGECNPPFWIARLVPPAWQLSDALVWRYDISYDPAKGKYKPYYEWILRFTRGSIRHAKGHRYLQDHYIPILKGNSRERANLVHPAIYPKRVVKACLAASGHEGLVVDPFLGSGTTIAAAWELGRPSIGFEIDERYVPDIEARLRQASRPARGPR